MELSSDSETINVYVSLPSDNLIVECTTSSSTQLIEALTNINTTLSTTPSYSFVEAILSGMASVIAAFIFNYFYWKRKEESERLQSAINDVIKTISLFEESSSNYWSSDYSVATAQISSIQEDRIKANLLIAHGSFKNQIKPHIDIKEGERITKSIADLYNLATGGDFETSRRKSNPKLVSKIINRCAKLIIDLSKLKK